MKYSVLLAFSKDDPCLKVYEVLGEKLVINEHTFLDVSCDQLASDALYLQMRLDAPPARQGLSVWIPHRYVALVYCEQDRKIGFLDS